MSYMAITDDNSRRAQYQRILEQEMINRDVAVMEWMLENENGRWFLQRMFESCQLTGVTFTGNSTTFYKEGRRSVPCELFALIRGRLGKKGLEQLHKAEMEMLEFRTRCEDAAKEMEDEDGY